MTKLTTLMLLCAVLGVGPLSAKAKIGADDVGATTEGVTRIDSILALSQKPFLVERRRGGEVKDVS